MAGQLFAYHGSTAKTRLCSQRHIWRVDDISPSIFGPYLIFVIIRSMSTDVVLKASFLFFSSCLMHNIVMPGLCVTTDHHDAFIRSSLAVPG